MAIRIAVAPRDVPPREVARHLGLSLGAFELVREELFARGFPRPDPTTGNYDLVAVGAWMDARHGGSLTSEAKPRNAAEVFGERAARLRNG